LDCPESSSKDLNLINEIKNLNLLRFNFLSKSAQTGQPNIIQISDKLKFLIPVPIACAFYCVSSFIFYSNVTSLQYTTL